MTFSQPGTNFILTEFVIHETELGDGNVSMLTCMFHINSMTYISELVNTSKTYKISNTSKT